jgi:hypothetical protein
MTKKKNLFQTFKPFKPFQSLSEAYSESEY